MMARQPNSADHMVAHTSGPFVVLPREPDIGGFTIEIEGEVELPVAIVPKNRRPEAEAFANATLFAAAPDLLAALKLCEPFCKGHQDTSAKIERYRLVRTAIAKAEAANVNPF
jgi:hypothetical protein